MTIETERDQNVSTIVRRAPVTINNRIFYLITRRNKTPSMLSPGVGTQQGKPCVSIPATLGDKGSINKEEHVPCFELILWILEKASTIKAALILSFISAPN
ncbi:unnamed protein product [Spodoptera littoralis]|uniref:Uncharacterized protein n=1 Tax=Spodoptera littoralis TaxID=7109 RepID=A0A9P0HZ87_SPOLI|nr:unnamed protein product [Spodoptera littoralis]CAH1637137.1 unnamed protein product [Spodoptera littoralis]